MQDNIKYDILFLVDGGIGNVLEALYAVEYCIVNKKKTGVYIKTLSPSFVAFLRKGYGDDVILKSTENIATTHLIHSFTYDSEISIAYDYYFYIQPDGLSSKQLSETEQYLSVVKGLYPSTYQNQRLQFLPELFSDKVQKLQIEKKTVLYPGCSADYAAKRWPYFMDLMKHIGENQTIILGSTDDLNFEFSYYYPKWISVLPQKLLNAKFFYNFCKSARLLKAHAHYKNMDKLANAYFNAFNWEELVAIFNRCRYFIGNDGGLMHLAACCGVKGKALFGPSSVDKNKAYNEFMKPVQLKYDCQPCSLGAKGINYSGGIIACPYQLRCQYSMTVESIVSGV